MRGSFKGFPSTDHNEAWTVPSASESLLSSAYPAITESEAAVEEECMGDQGYPIMHLVKPLTTDVRGRMGGE